MAVYCLDLGKKRLIIMIHSAQTDCRAQCPCKSNIPIMHFIDETDPAHTSHININKHDNFEGLFSVKKKKERERSFFVGATNKQTNKKHSNLSVFTRAARGPTPRRETRYCFISSLLICAYLFCFIFFFFKKKQMMTSSLRVYHSWPNENTIFLPRYEIRKWSGMYQDLSTCTE